MTVRQAHEELKHLVERAQAAGNEGGVTYGAAIRLLPPKDREVYLKLVRQLRRATRFTTQKVYDVATIGGNKIFADEPCEHCLQDGPTKLIKVKRGRVGLASGHENGDFVCAECHPWVAMRVLERLVGESA